jgi:hypothetical protein
MLLQDREHSREVPELQPRFTKTGQKGEEK